MTEKCTPSSGFRYCCQNCDMPRNINIAMGDDGDAAWLRRHSDCKAALYTRTLSLKSKGVRAAPGSRRKICAICTDFTPKWLIMCSANRCTESAISPGHELTEERSFVPISRTTMWGIIRETSSRCAHKLCTRKPPVPRNVTLHGRSKSGAHPSRLSCTKSDSLRTKLCPNTRTVGWKAAAMMRNQGCNRQTIPDNQVWLYLGNIQEIRKGASVLPPSKYARDANYEFPRMHHSGIKWRTGYRM
jgi:hypothetical protein